jgi:hypothetical protein
MNPRRCGQRLRWPRLRWAVAPAVSAALAAAIPGPACADAPVSGYGQNASGNDARFGALLGAGSQWESTLAPGSKGSGNFSFGGGARLGCSGIDFNGFLHAFDPAELLAEMRNTLLTGAQAAASNYLITLAYANPTIASALDMLDKKYSARFSAFAQGCDAQAARARGQEAGARAMASAGDQCFDREIAQGTAPTEAYRRCSILHAFDSLDLPAAASTADFLRKYTSINVTREMEGLLALLPDERISGGSYQMRPAQMTVASMSTRLRDQARAALDRIDAGSDPASIAPCTADRVLAASPPSDGCLPAAALPLVTSSAFRSARLLGDASRTLFKDALSSQIAIGAMYSNLLELFQQVARIDVPDSAGADAAHAGARRHQLQESIAELLTEADTQVKAQAAKAQLARSQIAALEQVESELDAQGRVASAKGELPQFGVRDLLHAFSGTN